MRLRSGVWTTETSGRLGKRCWRREGNGGKQPRQPRQREPPTYGRVGTRAATRNSPPSGTSGASTSAAPIGALSSSGPRHLRQPRRRRRPSSVVSGSRCSRRDPTSSRQNDSDDGEDSDDGIMAEVAELRAKETRRLALKRACRARYRVRHPERVAEYRPRYYAQNRERIAEYRRQYRARNAERVAQQRRVYQTRYIAKRKELMRQHYARHADRLREHKRNFYRSEAGQRWQKQYSARKRESAALLRQQRGPMVQKATEEKRQALGPLKLTVTVEDFMEDFCNSLSPSPEDSIDQPGTLMDMDSGVFHPLDHFECNESSCDMWDEGKGFLDNLLDDLPSSSSDDSLLLDLDDLYSSFDFLTDMMEDSSFDLDDFVI